MNSSKDCMVDGARVETIERPGSVELLAAELKKAHAARRSVLPMGLGTRVGAGRPALQADLALSTASLARIVHYEPGDLTITVEAGVELSEIDRVLAEKGQFLPLQARRRRGSVGGLLATAPEGGVALGYGVVRDRLTGLKVALADGALAQGGGRVVKNVAGYPIHRLMIGSFGTLGVIVEASFRVHPRPELERTVSFGFASERDAFQGARCALDSGLEPVFVNVLLEGDERRLVVGFDGFRSRVEAHLGRIVNAVAPSRPEECAVLTDDQNESLRRRLDDQAGAAGSGLAPGRAGAASGEDGPSGNQPFGDARGSARAGGIWIAMQAGSLPAEVERLVLEARKAARDEGAEVVVDARPGTGSAYLSLKSPEPGPAVSALGAALAAARRTGHAVVLSAPPEVRRAVDPWGPLPSDFQLMKRIKDALDPTGVFASGRFVGGI